MTIPHEVFVAVGIFCIAATLLQLVLDAHQAISKDGAIAAKSLLARYIGTFAALYMVLRSCGLL